MKKNDEIWEDFWKLCFRTANIPPDEEGNKQIAEYFKDEPEKLIYLLLVVLPKDSSPDDKKDLLNLLVPMIKTVSNKN